MKMTLRKRFLFLLTVSNFFIALGIGGSLYHYAGNLYYHALVSGKVSLARSIALSIDGERHGRFNTLKSVYDNEYRKYLKYLNSIRVQEKYISYFFTINYDRKSDRLTYAVDADINPVDVIWISTEYFGLALSLGSDGRFRVKYNEAVNTGDFDIYVEGVKTPLRIDPDGLLWIGGKELARIVSRSPLELEVSGRRLNIRSREIYGSINLNGKPVDLYCSFTGSGESQSMPGELYAESHDVVERCKSIIRSRNDTVVERDVQTSIYGKNITSVYSVIRDSSGNANGLVVIEIFQQEVARFKRAIILICAAVSVLSFIVILLMTSFLAEYIIKPVRELTKAARRVGEGDLDFTLETDRNDEFGTLTVNFNKMISSLKSARTESATANNELRHFKENLEAIVEEKTEQLLKSKMDLNNVISEVITLKGLLPICSSCKKIRDDSGYWNQIENYISKHSQAEFTHSLCPTCAKKLYPGYYRGEDQGF